MGSLVPLLTTVTGALAALVSLFGLFGFASRRTRLKRDAETLRACFASSDWQQRRSLELPCKHADAQLIADLLVPRWQPFLQGTAYTLVMFCLSWYAGLILSLQLLGGNTSRALSMFDVTIIVVTLFAGVVGCALLAWQPFDLNEERVANIIAHYFNGVPIDLDEIRRRTLREHKFFKVPTPRAWLFSLSLGTLVVTTAFLGAFWSQDVSPGRWRGIFVLLLTAASAGIFGILFAVASHKDARLRVLRDIQASASSTRPRKPARRRAVSKPAGQLRPSRRHTERGRPRRGRGTSLREIKIGTRGR